MERDQSVGFGRFLEDFKEGAVYIHAVRKTITESDNNLFCLLTMNHHPVHLDWSYAEKSQHGRVLVVGTLVFSVVVGLTVADISGRAIANLCYEDVRHDGPVHLGDTLHAETEVLAIRPSRSRPDRGVVHVKTCAYNQNDERVLSFSRKVLVPKRNV